MRSSSKKAHNGNSNAFSNYLAITMPIQLIEHNQSIEISSTTQLELMCTKAAHVCTFMGSRSTDLPDVSLDEAVRIADALMYRVKAGGKNQTFC